MPPSSPRTNLDVKPLDTAISFRLMAYESLKKAITAMDIYDHDEEIRLDERKLAEDMAVSRTPIREAMNLLEQEGFVRSVPRRGIFVVRKTKKQIIEMIVAWAALESMAARLAATQATDAELAELHQIMREYEKERPADHMSEYSSANIAFHQKIIEISGNQAIVDMTSNLFIHVRAIRKVTIRQEDRAARSIVDHLNIIKALEERNGELAERLVREHTLGLAAHVERHGDFLDVDGGS